MSSLKDLRDKIANAFNETFGSAMNSFVARGQQGAQNVMGPNLRGNQQVKNIFNNGVNNFKTNFDILTNPSQQANRSLWYQGFNTPDVKPMTRFIADITSPTISAVGGLRQMGSNYSDAFKNLDHPGTVAEDIFKGTLTGGTKALTAVGNAINPLYYLGAAYTAYDKPKLVSPIPDNMVSQQPPQYDSGLRTFASHAIRGMAGNPDLAGNVKDSKPVLTIKTPEVLKSVIGNEIKFNPAQILGDMYGFTQNPGNKVIMQGTNILNNIKPSKALGTIKQIDNVLQSHPFATKAFDYLTSKLIAGTPAGLTQGINNINPSDSKDKQTQTVINGIIQGAVTNLVMSALGDSAKYGLNKAQQTELGKYVTKIANQVGNSIKEQIRVWSMPTYKLRTVGPDQMAYEARPLWMDKLEELNTWLSDKTNGGGNIVKDINASKEDAQKAFDKGLISQEDLNMYLHPDQFPSSPALKIKPEPTIKISKSDVSKLEDLGYTPWEIDNMTPQDVKTIAKEGILPDANYSQNADIKSPTQSVADTKAQLDEMPKQSKADRIAQIEANKQFAESPEGKKAFNESFANWVGQKQSANTKGLIEAQPLTGLDKKTSLEVIKGIEKPGSVSDPKVQGLIDQLSQQYDELYSQAQDAGVNMGYQENYITHIWEKNGKTMTPEQVKSEYASLRGKFKFSQDRTFPTYEEGIKAGWTPKYTEPSQIVANYVSNLEKVKANLDFFNELKNNDVILPASMADSSWKPVVAQGFPRDGRSGEIYYAPPEIADKINNVFSKPDNGFWGKFFNIGANISRTTQEVTLSGGIPHTPVNAFGIAQVTKEALGGRPVSAAKAIFANDQFFQDNLDTIQKLQEHNIPITTSYNIDSLAPQSLKDKVFGDNLSEAWHKNIDEPTFRKLLPALQINLFNDIEKQALDQKMDPQMASDVAAEAVKNFYGIIGSDTMAGRPKIGQDINTTVFFAPKYRESMINFWPKTLQSILPVKIENGKLNLNNPLSLQNKTNTIFALTSIATYLGMNALNQKLNGHPMSENPKGKEDKLLIPLSKVTGDPNNTMTLGIPFLSSIATMPRTAYKIGKNLISGDYPQAMKESTSLLSTPIQSIGQIANNQDYFGNPIYDVNDPRGQQLLNQATYLGTNLNHPWLKAGLEAAKTYTAGGDTTKKDSGNAILDNLTTKGVKPYYQIASQAVESPIRFYNNIKGSYYFDQKDKILKTVDTKTQNDYNALHDGNTPVTVAPEGQSKQQSMTNASIRLNNPNVFITEKNIALATAAKTGEPVDPLYTVPFETAYTYLRYQSFGGSLTSEGKQLYKEHPEIGELAQARSAFFTANPTGQTGSGSTAPRPSARAQQLMDQGNFRDPEVRAYLDANTQWKNEQRALLGLGPLAGSGFGFNYKKKIAIKKVNIKLPGLSKKTPRKIPSLKLSIPSIKLTKKKPKNISIKVTKAKKITVKGFTNTLNNGTRLA